MEIIEPKGLVEIISGIPCCWPCFLSSAIPPAGVPSLSSVTLLQSPGPRLSPTCRGRSLVSHQCAWIILWSQPLLWWPGSYHVCLDQAPTMCPSPVLMSCVPVLFFLIESLSWYLIWSLLIESLETYLAAINMLTLGVPLLISSLWLCACHLPMVVTTMYWAKTSCASIYIYGAFNLHNISIVQMRKMKCREVEWLAPEHTVLELEEEKEPELGLLVCDSCCWITASMSMLT